MKAHDKFKVLMILGLLVSLLLGQFSLLIVEATEDVYALMNSKVINDQGEWVTGGGGFPCNTGVYNCYAYAISLFGDSKFYDLNFGDKYQPGDIYVENTTIPDNDTLSNVRDNVILDLEAVGHNDISVYYNYNDLFDAYGTSIIDFSTHEIICFRIGTYIGSDIKDYHFMRYDNVTLSWYHKPSLTTVLKYTGNNGIPSNNVSWSNESVDGNGIASAPNIIYNSEIWYIAYDRMQFILSEEGLQNESIIIKGGENTYSGKDVIYEIIVPETGTYNIQLTTEYASHDFNYEIYSYNMYNGDYETHKSGSGNSTTAVIEAVDLVAANDVDNPYQVFKHYIRLDFGRQNTSDQSINVSITPHTHDYTYDGEKISSFMHKAYCWCGEYITEGHMVVDGVCSLCGATHTHRFSYSWNSYTMHQKRCLCGYATTEPHVVSSNPIYDSDGYTTCLLCGGKVSNYLDNCSINQLPHTENGSYVTPSGIIVLVDEDIEAYLSGELIFLAPEGETEIS